MTVWDDLVGQEKVSEPLAAAARDADAFVTAAAADGPAPRDVEHDARLAVHRPARRGVAQTARAFAAALQCVSPDRALGGVPGCGFCDGCHTALVGTHADVSTVVAMGAEIRVTDMRDTVRKSFTSPANGRWQIIPRRRGRAAEREIRQRRPEGRGGTRSAYGLAAVRPVRRGRPAPRSVPRCRHLNLRTPTVDAVAPTCSYGAEGVEPDAAAAAARATQGHIDRARRLATDPAARSRRAAVLKLPLRVEDVGGALKAAQELVDARRRTPNSSPRRWTPRRPRS